MLMLLFLKLFFSVSYDGPQTDPDAIQFPSLHSAYRLLRSTPEITSIDTNATKTDILSNYEDFPIPVISDKYKGHRLAPIFKTDLFTQYTTDPVPITRNVHIKENPPDFSLFTIISHRYT